MAKGLQATPLKPPALVQRETIAQRYALARTVVRYTAFVAIAWIAKDMILGLAGRDTLVAVRLAILGDFKFAAALSVTGPACIWAIAERWLRHRKVTYMQDRIKDLEAKIDPNRTSSRLTTAGKTNPGDRQL